MPLLDTLPVGAGTTRWPVWGTTARLVVTDPDRLPAARAAVEAELAAVDRACSRFRPDSEIRALAAGGTHRVSAVLAEYVAVALDAARRTDGDVNPTLGFALVRLGDTDRIRRPAPPAPGAPRVSVVRLQLDGRDLTLPPGVLLDLGATAKAHAADRCARLVAERCDTGVLVSLGGDLATAGPAPDGGWRVLVQDGPAQPACTIALPAGAALATSSTISRQWRIGGRLLHHILDPRTCRPAPPVWRTVSVAANRCVDANTASTAAIVRGDRAPAWLRGLGLPARLVAADGRVRTVGGWP